MEERNNSKSLENAGVFILGLFLVLLPILFATISTDAFAIPKQALLGIVSAVGIFLVALRAVSSGILRIRRTPFDVPLLLFGIAGLLSSFFSVNRFDSLISFVPIIFGLMLFFSIINLARSEKSANFLNLCFLGGAAILSVFSLLSYFKIYILPFSFSKSQLFTPFGSSLDQLIYLSLALSFALHLSLPYLKRLRNGDRRIGREGIFPVLSTIVLLTGLCVTAVIAVTLQKPAILPFATGFQTAFASISQDTGRVVQGFLFGSGFGTYLTDFTRFKQASFNLNPNIWNLYFFRSSSFMLELLATVGVLGIASFSFLLYRMVRLKPLILPLIVSAILVFLLPFSIINLTAFIIILSLVSITETQRDEAKSNFSETEIQLVSFSKGVLSLSGPEPERRNSPRVLPYGFLTAVVILILLLGFFTGRFLYSDYIFQKAILAASQNQGSATYELQRKAIGIFPQREAYHRVFSQTNLNLANSLASSIQPGSSPSAQTQQTIYTLIQQSINSARQSTALSPASSLSWQSMAQIYRSLIGFGQNAENFAIAATQRSIALDSNNPQLYVSLGGIYYQMGQYDNAIREFQVAITLKPDFANAYYNLGHALEQKGDLQNALVQYQTVRNLVQANKDSLATIDKEIKALQDKIGQGSESAKDLGDAQNQPPLGVDQPAAQLPEQKPPVQIQGPQITVTPSKSPTPTPKQ